MDEQALIFDVLQGEVDAISLISDLSRVSQIWDDLVDGDKEVSVEAVNDAFITLISRIPRNHFYQKHLNEIQPVIELVVVDWLTANHFEETQEMLPLAWSLRDNMASLLACCAKIIGGIDWAIRVSPKIRKFVHNEALEIYTDELKRTKS